MIYEPFDVVVVPFPFTDSAQTKRRPALVLSQHTNFGNKIGHSVLAIITSREIDTKNSRGFLGRLHFVVIFFHLMTALLNRNASQ